MFFMGNRNEAALTPAQKNDIELQVKNYSKQLDLEAEDHYNIVYMRAYLIDNYRTLLTNDYMNDNIRRYENYKRVGVAPYYEKKGP